MDIYLTHLSTGESLRIPLLPDRVSASDRTNMITLSIIAMGEVRIPRGSKLSEYSWQGTFPGAHMKNMAFLRVWAKPESYINRLRTWRMNGDKLRLMITDTPINADVLIDSFTFEAAGGMGDYTYNISLVDARTVTVSTVQEAGIETDTLSKMISAHYVAIRPPSVTSNFMTHTVVAGDTLYTIAARYLGDGSRWEEIYALNREMIDAANKGKTVTKDTIYVGQVLLVKEKPAPPVQTPVQSPPSSSGSSGSSKRSSSKNKNPRPKKEEEPEQESLIDKLSGAAKTVASAVSKIVGNAIGKVSSVSSSIKKAASYKK